MKELVTRIPSLWLISSRSLRTGWKKALSWGLTTLLKQMAKVMTMAKRTRSARPISMRRLITSYKEFGSLSGTGTLLAASVRSILL